MSVPRCAAKHDRLGITAPHRTSPKKNFSPRGSNEKRGFSVTAFSPSPFIFRRASQYNPTENTRQQISTEKSDRHPSIPGTPTDASITAVPYANASRNRSAGSSSGERAACHAASSATVTGMAADRKYSILHRNRIVISGCGFQRKKNSRINSIILRNPFFKPRSAGFPVFAPAAVRFSAESLHSAEKTPDPFEKSPLRCYCISHDFLINIHLKGSYHVR